MVRVTIPSLLVALAATLAIVDCVWGLLGHFNLDLAAYLKLALMSLALMAGSAFYRWKRDEPQLAAMLFGTGFLCAFSAGASVLNYFLLTVVGKPIDKTLVEADRMLGFDWYKLMLAMVDHPYLNEAFFRIYNLVLPQMAVLLVALAWSGRADRVYRYCLAVAIGALVAIFIWAVMPSLGAKSLYTLPLEVTSRLNLSVTTDYGRDLLRLLRDGPGYITPADLRGLIAFPSYHGVLAILLIWYALPLRWLRWPFLAINSVVLICTPEQGGHHLIDVLAAFPVAALSIYLASMKENAFIAMKPASVVNKLRKFTIRPVPQGFFRITPEQKPDVAPPAIKSKLSGIS
jgi:PAP2 superfamily